MPEDVNGTGGGMQIGVSGPFGGQGGVVGGANPNTNINPNPFNNTNPGTGFAPIAGSGSGDIILDNSGGKKKKVWLIVVVIVLVVLAILGLVAVLVLNIPKNNLSINDYMEQYLSLLEYGKENEEDFSSGDISVKSLSNEEAENIYAIPRFSDPLSEKNVNYYNALQRVLDGMREKAASVESGEDIIFLVDDSKTLISYYFVAAALVYTNASYNYFIQNGNLEGFLSAYGYPFDVGEEDKNSFLASTIRKAYNMRAEVYNEISRTNCVTDERVDYACLQYLNSESLMEKQMKDSSFERVLKSYIEDMLEELIVDVDDMKVLLNGDGDE